MNLLVTGGAGFIGSHAVEFFLERPEVERLFNLDALTYAGLSENVHPFVDHSKHKFVRADLRDKDDLVSAVREYQITHVVHLAAESHVDRSIESANEFIHTNVVGTLNLLEACRDFWSNSEFCPPHTANRFVHVSTDEVYGSLGSDGLFTEQSPYAPNSPYAASKAAADMLVRSYIRTYDFPAIITNCTNNYGPRQHPEKLFPVAIQAILNRQSIPIYGNGQQIRDWIHVSDHVEALWRVLASGKTGETYNIGSRNESTNLNLIELLCDLADEIYPGLGGNSRELIEFVADRPGHDQRYAIDPTRLQRELGWKPGVEFSEGIRKTVRWYCDNQAWLEAATRPRTKDGGTDWEECYQLGDTRWDKGEASPGLVDWLAQHPDEPKGTILIPGCGFGYDARVWSEAEHDATGVDLAPSAIRGSENRTKSTGLATQFNLGNFLDDEPFAQFDWIFEHTLFCAISPTRRADYVEAVRRWLKPGGQFLAVHYFIPDTEGPPFGTNREEIIERFSPHFELISDWIPRSYPNRTNLERMFWWRIRA